MMPIAAAEFKVLKTILCERYGIELKEETLITIREICGFFASLV